MKMAVWVLCWTEIWEQGTGPFNLAAYPPRIAWLGSGIFKSPTFLPQIRTRPLCVFFRGSLQPSLPPARGLIFLDGKRLEIREKVKIYIPWTSSLDFYTPSLSLGREEGLSLRWPHCKSLMFP